LRRAPAAARAPASATASSSSCSTRATRSSRRRRRPAARYLFERRDFPTFLLPLQTYRIRIRVPQGGGTFDQLLNYQPTLVDVGTNDAVDSDHSFPSGASRTLAFTALFTAPTLGQQDLTRDFGWVPILRIGDYVWRDDDASGLQNEAVATNGLNGVQIELYRGATLVGQLLTTSTPNNGFYQFDSRTFDIVPGTSYTLSIQVCTPTNSSRNAAALCPAGSLVPLVPTLANAAMDTNDMQDSDGLFERTGTALSPRAIVTFTAPPYGTTTSTIDFGFVQPLAVGDQLFVDQNGNGVQDDLTLGVQPGVSGISVALVQGGATLATTLTNPGGFYIFSELSVPTLAVNTPYTVQVDMTQPLLANYIVSPRNSAATTDALDSTARCRRRSRRPTSCSRRRWRRAAT
jgi:hypothetical protein